VDGGIGFDWFCFSGAIACHGVVTFCYAKCYVRFAFLKLGLFFQKGYIWLVGYLATESTEDTEREI
jgi:hypothetical protein